MRLAFQRRLHTSLLVCLLGVCVLPVAGVRDDALARGSLVDLREGGGDSDPDPYSVPSFCLTEACKHVRRVLVANGGPIVQMLIGDAIGDAFGFMIEFEDAYWIRKNVVLKNVSEGRKTWPVRSYKPDWWKHTVNYDGMRGMYSDDCEMTVGLMKSFMRCGEHANKTCMLEGWKAEWDLSGQRPEAAGMKDGELVKRAGHGSIVDVWQGKKDFETLRKMQADKEDPGNAPPMRSIPIGYLKGHLREQAVRENADSTHPHKKSRAASFLIATAVDWLAIQGGETKSVLKACLFALRKSELSENLTEVHLEKVEALPDWHDLGERFSDMEEDTFTFLMGPQPMRPSTPGAEHRPRFGVDSDAMRTAGIVLYLLKWHRPGDAYHTLLAAVDVGGDVDSTAALTLGIVGAAFGLDFGTPGGIPWWMVEELEGVEYLYANAKKFEQWLVDTDGHLPHKVDTTSEGQEAGRPSPAPAPSGAAGRQWPRALWVFAVALLYPAASKM